MHDYVVGPDTPAEVLQARALCADQLPQVILDSSLPCNTVTGVLLKPRVQSDLRDDLQQAKTELATARSELAESKVLSLVSKAAKVRLGELAAGEEAGAGLSCDSAEDLVRFPPA